MRENGSQEGASQQQLQYQHPPYYAGYGYPPYAQHGQYGQYVQPVMMMNNGQYVPMMMPYNNNNEYDRRPRGNEKIAQDDDLEDEVNKTAGKESSKKDGNMIVNKPDKVIDEPKKKEKEQIGKKNGKREGQSDDDNDKELKDEKRKKDKKKGDKDQNKDSDDDQVGEGQRRGEKDKKSKKKEKNKPNKDGKHNSLESQSDIKSEVDDISEDDDNKNQGAKVNKKNKKLLPKNAVKKSTSRNGVNNENGKEDDNEDESDQIGEEEDPHNQSSDRKDSHIPKKKDNRSLPIQKQNKENNINLNHIVSPEDVPYNNRYDEANLPSHHLNPTIIPLPIPSNNPVTKNKEDKKNNKNDNKYNHDNDSERDERHNNKDNSHKNQNPGILNKEDRESEGKEPLHQPYSSDDNHNSLSKRNEQNPNNKLQKEKEPNSQKKNDKNRVDQPSLPLPSTNTDQNRKENLENKKPEISLSPTPVLKASSRDLNGESYQAESPKKGPTSKRSSFNKDKINNNQNPLDVTSNRDNRSNNSYKDSPSAFIFQEESTAKLGLENGKKKDKMLKKYKQEMRNDPKHKKRGSESLERDFEKLGRSNSESQDEEPEASILDASVKQKDKISNQKIKADQKPTETGDSKNGRPNMLEVIPKDNPKEVIENFVNPVELPSSPYKRKQESQIWNEVSRVKNSDVNSKQDADFPEDSERKNKNASPSLVPKKMLDEIKPNLKDDDDKNKNKINKDILKDDKMKATREDDDEDKEKMKKLPDKPIVANEGKTKETDSIPKDLKEKDKKKDPSNNELINDSKHQENEEPKKKKNSSTISQKYGDDSVSDNANNKDGIPKKYVKLGQPKDLLLESSRNKQPMNEEVQKKQIVSPLNKFPSNESKGPNNEDNSIGNNNKEDLYERYKRKKRNDPLDSKINPLDQTLMGIADELLEYNDDGDFDHEYLKRKRQLLSSNK